MSREVRIDPASPVPLYHQIAEAIRTDIEAGKLGPGEALEPLRRAAASWNVNLHTVRHAYAALARSGLVERSRGPRGTRVARGRRSRPERDGGLQPFLARFAREAETRFGLGPAELARALEELGDASPRRRPPVFVVECSLWQCESHARELSERFDVAARPWPLDRAGRGNPPQGTIVSTYFHYNDIRRAWPRRLAAVRFITIRPDPALRERLSGARRVIVVEHDRSTIDAVTADLEALLDDDGIDIETHLVRDGREFLKRRRGAAPVLFTPRVWATLHDSARAEERAVELRYTFDDDELDELGAALGWRRRRKAA